jgi:SpoVK/Ycf46/Vps4 family AAA+-type ATPase
MERQMPASGLDQYGELFLYRLTKEQAMVDDRAPVVAALVGTPVHAPIDRVGRAFGLGQVELELLLLLAAADRRPELWINARAFHRDTSRPGFDCATAALALDHPVPVLIAAADELRRLELITTPQASGAYRPFVPLFAVPRIVDVLAGEAEPGDTLDGTTAWFELPDGAADVTALVIPPGFADSLRAVLGRRLAQPPIVIIQGLEGVGKRTLVRAVAAEHGLPTLVIDGLELSHDPNAMRAQLMACLREARLADAVVLVDNADGILEPQRRQVMAGMLGGLPRAPVLASTGGVVECAPRGRAVVRVSLPVPEAPGRQILWTRHLADHASAEDLHACAQRYPITPGLIRRASAAARIVTSEGRVSPEHVKDAIGDELAERFRGIGTRVEKHEKWEDLVLPPETQDAVTELISRVRNKRRVMEQWGFGSKLVKGLSLSVLFSGEPGTGKTMVASLIAAELGLQLYQIDLANLVSKYIGETEKNLARAFDAGEAGHAVLLFDEADALFGKRSSEVKSATDRYANMEINYLLQRIERFSGVAILTTNLAAAIDPAFLRRLSVHVRFEMPDDDARAELWQRLLPSAAPREGQIDFGSLGRNYKFSGGYIRNAVLRAAYLAAADGRSITMNHLRRAADLEAWEMGRVAGGGTPQRL